MDLEQQAIMEFFKKAKKGDNYTLQDPQGNPVVYQMQPGSYVNVAGQEEDPFIQAYLNSIDNEAMGQKVYPKRIK